MTEKTRRYIEERAKGKKFTEIAAMFGVSYQTVAQACSRFSPGHARPLTQEECTYPNLRKWLNENRITRAELWRRLGVSMHTNNYKTYGNYLSGKTNPPKDVIDKLLAMTGMTYEKCFAVDFQPWEDRYDFFKG